MNNLVLTGELEPKKMIEPKLLTSLAGVDLSSPSSQYLLSLQSKESRKTMCYHLDKVARMLGANGHESLNWHGLDSITVLLIRNKLSLEELAPKTINAVLCAIRQTCIHSFSDPVNGMSADTLKRIELIKNIKGTRVRPERELKYEEIKGIELSCDDKTLLGLRDKALFLLAIGCGLRRAELTNIRMKDLRVDEGEIIVNGKGKKQRVAYPPIEIWNVINEYIEETRFEAIDEDFLFVSFTRSDEPRKTKKDEAIVGLERTSVNYIFSQRCKKAGITAFKPHDLRKTYATKMLRDGVDIKVVQLLLGHENLATTSENYDLRQFDEAKAFARNHSIYPVAA